MQICLREEASIQQELGHCDLDSRRQELVCLPVVVIESKGGHEANFVISDYPPVNSRELLLPLGSTFTIILR